MEAAEQQLGVGRDVSRAAAAELQRYIPIELQPFPIRLDDRLEEDLLIDVGEDLSLIVESIRSATTGLHQVPRTERDWASVQTVRDLLMLSVGKI